MQSFSWSLKSDEVEGNGSNKDSEQVDCSREYLSGPQLSIIPIRGEMNCMMIECGSPSRLSAVSMISSSQHEGAVIEMSEHDISQHAS